jgi:hypothetical protein
MFQNNEKAKSSDFAFFIVGKFYDNVFYDNDIFAQFLKQQ